MIKLADVPNTKHAMSVKISPRFKEIESLLSDYSINCFNDPERVESYWKRSNLELVCSPVPEDSLRHTKTDPREGGGATKPFGPQHADLSRLHYLILSRKPISVIELGSGFSTCVIADALNILSIHFKDWVLENIRIENPFHLFSVEEDRRFLEITQARLGDRLAARVTLQQSMVELVTHDNRVATMYSSLPNITPDFIYLDGPSQQATKSREIRGISPQGITRMPMSADVLQVEFFLEPGTFILVDGRSANASFLRSYLRRDWAYQRDTLGDVHYFELQETPLGRSNSKKIDFCLGGQWKIKRVVGDRNA